MNWDFLWSVNLFDRKYKYENKDCSLLFQMKRRKKLLEFDDFNDCFKYFTLQFGSNHLHFTAKITALKNFVKFSGKTCGGVHINKMWGFKPSISIRTIPSQGISCEVSC